MLSPNDWRLSWLPTISSCLCLCVFCTVTYIRSVCLYQYPCFHRPLFLFFFHSMFFICRRIEGKIMKVKGGIKRKEKRRLIFKECKMRFSNFPFDLMDAWKFLSWASFSCREHVSFKFLLLSCPHSLSSSPCTKHTRSLLPSRAIYMNIVRII